MINFFFPTAKNNYTPNIFKSHIIGSIFALLLIFNILSSTIFTGLLSKVNAANIAAGDVIALTNSSRASAGLGTLSYNQALTNAACSKAANMFALNYWSHYGPNGESPFTFILNAGYAYKVPGGIAGENLGKGFTTASALHNAWMNSTTHRNNIMKPEFKDIGVCVRTGTLLGEQTILVVQMFGYIPKPIVTTTQTTTTPIGTSSSAATTTTAKQTITSTKTTTVQNTIIAGTTKSNTTQSNIQKTATIATKQSNTVLTAQTNTNVVTKPNEILNPPNILNPINDIWSNAKEIMISGNINGSTNIDKIKIYENDKEIGENIIKDGGIWDYNYMTHEGKSSIYVKAINKNSDLSPSSKVININIDQKLPIVSPNSFKFIEKDITTGEYKFSINFQDNNNITDAKILNQNYKNTFDNVQVTTTDTTVKFAIKVSSLQDIHIYIKDIANNEFTHKITKDIFERYIEIVDKQVLADSESAQNDALSISGFINNIKKDIVSVFTNFENYNVKQTVNFVFLAVLLAILFIDAIIIRQKKIKIDRSNSAIHALQIIIILMLILSTGFGNIL